MIDKEGLQQELNNKRSAFSRLAAGQNSLVERLREVLRTLCTSDLDELTDRLAGSPASGALPYLELERHSSISIGFREHWTSHEDARKWAASVLAKRTTFAADGSQIYAEKETSLPVGAVQVGWFENPHDTEIPYVKNARLELLTPEELFPEDEDFADPESRIGERLFRLEVESVREFIESRRGWEERCERMPLAFFDGTLLVSFPLPKTRLQSSFVDAMVGLIRLSEEARVPVVGFVDRSLSRDLINLLKTLGGIGSDAVNSVTDAFLLFSLEDEMVCWGDRTCFFLSNRRGMEAYTEPGSGISCVGFSYLQTSSSAPPARLDIPRWVADAGLLDELADIVRAECVIGIGYPYPIETADQTALISASDRRVFLKALQEFAVREELNFSVARKDASKARRR